MRNIGINERMEEKEQKRKEKKRKEKKRKEKKRKEKYMSHITSTVKARACGASVRSSDCGSKGMGFDPHSGQSKVRLSLSILTHKVVLVVQSRRVPTPPSTGSLVSV
jgi:hypothetical protein